MQWSLVNSLDQADRRDFLAYIARSCLGVTAAGVGSGLFTGAGTVLAAPTGAAKNVIYLRMTGAMTHIDTFDPKPGKPEGGETKPIQTATPGIQIGEHLPLLAKQTAEMAIVRSLTTSTADHQQASYLLQTSYREIASIRHPAMGAFANNLLGLRKKSLPDYIVVGGANKHPGAGYLEAEYTPVPIGDPNLGLQNTKPPKYLTDQAFDKRMQLIDQFSAGFRKKFPQKQVEAYQEFYRQANDLMDSADLKVFDLAQEKQDVRDKYGKDRFGQGCLLARRLVEKDVRWIEVSFGNWDMHDNIYEDNALPARTAVLDQGLSTLLTELKEKGLLAHTLVVLATEFGRSPKINERVGRDHHPGAFSSVLAGAGIKGGSVYGQSDEKGFRPEKDGCTITDFNATIAQAMGLPLKKEITSKNGRPFKVAGEGKPLAAILA